ncbi:trans-sulfuration enzyme family protein, partial [Staphylococcus massiliensis]
DSANQPLYYSSTYHQDTLNGQSDYDYARSGNPNRKHLESKLAKLENATYALAFNAGISAINALFLSFKAGDHFILPDDVYGGTYRLTQDILTRFNLSFTTVDQIDLSAIERAIQPNTKLIYIETPSNPLFKVTDIKAITSLAQSHDILTAVDNTFMTPLGQSPLALGADVVIHSATKFLGGHSDMIAGALMTNDKALHQDLYNVQNGTGSALSVYDCWVLSQHLKTFPLRFQQSVQHAEKVIAFLKSHPSVAHVYYPGNDSVHQQQASTNGAVFGFRLKHEDAYQTFVDHLSIPIVAVSLGGVETILSHPFTMSHASIPEPVRIARGITKGLFRLSVGLEDPDILIEDLNQALNEVTDDDVT